MAQEPLEGIANATYEQRDTLTWETAKDWDQAAAETGVVHEDFGDLPGADVIQLGYPSYDPGGSALDVYLPMDEDSGSTVSDQSGNGNDGSLNGPATGQTGLHGTTSVEGDGVDDYIEIADSNSLDQGGAYTIMWWGYEHGTYTDYPRYLWKDAFPAGNSSDNNYGFYYHTADNFYTFEDGRDGGSTTWSTSKRNGTWTFWTLVDTGQDGEMQLWADATLRSSTSVSGTPPTNSNPLYIFAGENSRFMGARMENFRMYGRALSQSEIQDHYDSGTQGSLTTATKSFSSASTPDLQNLSYSLNGESIDLDVIGSPGTASEEVVTQTLDGGDSYSLTWADSHTDFRIRPSLSSSAVTATPTFSRGELLG